jgi:hypothetical protein
MLSLKLSAPVIGAFSAGLLALGLYGLSVESSPFLSTAGSAADRLQSLEGSPSIPVLSSKRALGVYDYDCRALAADIRKAGTPDEASRTDRACLERAKSLVSAAPGNARFWLTLAQFASRLPGQQELMLKAIRLSRTYAPSQAAFSYERIALIDSLREKPADVDAIIDADLAVLATGRRSRETLAKMYIAADQTRRDRITAAVTTRPANEQNNFLSMVRRSIQ